MKKNLFRRVSLFGAVVVVAAVAAFLPAGPVPAQDAKAAAKTNGPAALDGMPALVLSNALSHTLAAKGRTGRLGGIGRVRPPAAVSGRLAVAGAIARGAGAVFDALRPGRGGQGARFLHAVWRRHQRSGRQGNGTGHAVRRDGYRRHQSAGPL